VNWEWSAPADPDVQPPAGIGPQALNAVGKPVFVQFADGSTWGEREAWQGVLHDRSKALDRLLSLQQTYRTRGEKDFVEELIKPAQDAETDLLPAVIGSLQATYRSHGNDLKLVLAKLDQMLGSAERHLRDLRTPDDKRPE